MADFEDDQDLNSEQVKAVCSKCVDLILPNSLTYNHDKVNQWTQQILESCIKELAKMQKPFKYVVTCLLIQNNGSAFQSAANSHWDDKTDGMISFQLNRDTILCSVSVYCTMI